MAQDFAKQRPAPPQAARRGGRANVKPTPANSPWNWFISGIFTGALLVVLAYFGYQRYAATQPAVTDASAAAQVAAELPAFDFGFYDELATAEVTVQVPEGATPPGITAPPAAPATQTSAQPSVASAQPAAAVNYLLQAGSFQERNEAEERRAKITLLNMAAEIVPGVVAGRTWYRVQVGPFSGRPTAEEARKTLSANNIDSILLLMR